MKSFSLRGYLTEIRVTGGPDIDRRGTGSSLLAASRRFGTDLSKDGIMGLFRRSKTARASRKPTWRERKAAERTAQAEASLVETEQKIHEIADEARRDLKA